MAQIIRFNYLFPVASLLLLLLLVAAQSPLAEARKYIGVNQWCTTAYHRRLCTRMVNGAVTKDDATMNALKTTLEYAKRVQGMIGLVKPAIAALDPKTQESIMSTCTSDFSNRIDDLETSIGAMPSHDIGTILAHLSASLHNECDDALAEIRLTSPIAKYTKLLHKEVDNCLAILMQN
ncbi:hypothetical protein ACS0TY_010165 [Phlomoides rotata]